MHAVKYVEVTSQELDRASRKCGLKINPRKTKIMAGSRRLCLPKPKFYINREK